MATINFAPLLPPAIAPLAPAALPVGGSFPALPASLPLVTAGDADGAALLPAAAPASLSESASMRPDQLFMARQMAWPAFDGATLAAAWRGMVRTYGLQLAAMQQQAGGQKVPGNLLMAGQFPGAPALVQDGALLPHPDAWRFASPGPGNQLSLRVLAGGPDQPPGRRKRGKAALRVELTLADGSRASVQLEPVGDGVMLELATPFTSSVELLRAALPALKEIVEKAGLKLVRATLRHALAPGRPLLDSPAAAVAMLPAPLFRAMADIALALTAPASATATKTATL